MKLRVPCSLLFVFGVVVIGTLPVEAGQIDVAWDAVPGASGYHVYYGLSSGSYGQPLTAMTTSASITALQDCVTYFVAVKAFNGGGESPTFSNELSGWARPVVSSTTPSSAMQGDQVVVDILGTNFQSGAVVDLNPNPGICSLPTGPANRPYPQCNTDAECVQGTMVGTCQSLNTVNLTSVSVLSCTHVQLLATVQATAGGVRPAQVGKVDVTVVNPDLVFGMKPQAFEVLMNPARFDVNQSDAVTTNRIDGKDTVYLSRQFGWNEADLNSNYDADYDFDGDGDVDGDDLAQIASNLGGCWSTASNSWSVASCATGLR